MSEDWIRDLARAEKVKARELNGGRELDQADLETAMRAAVAKAIEMDTAYLPVQAANRNRSSRITFLERKREATKADLLLKFEDGDWHGVCDAGMDLRDIDSELKGLRL